MLMGGADEVEQLRVLPAKTGTNQTRDKDTSQSTVGLSEAEDYLRMKILILLIYILNLISGPVDCFDVIGYPGGSVMIFCENQQYKGSNKYFCKEKTDQCTHVETLHSWKHGDRVSLVSSPTFLTVFYRDLSLEDAGLYQCGETGVWNHTVNLRVKTDPCCSGPRTEIGYPGEITTINCSYPEEFQDYIKYFYKLKGQLINLMIDTTEPQKGRFSISDNRRSRVVSVRISDVREEDEGVYFCGVGIGRNSVGYETFFPKIHLQVSGRGASGALGSTAGTGSDVEFEAPGSSTIIIIIIISVSICVVLLLIGGLTLIFYKPRCSKTEGSASPQSTVTMGDVSKNTYSGPQVPTLTPEGLVYTTVSFQKNPGYSTDARINVSKKEPEPRTEYSIIKHPHK
ncbi:CMRF35-like molecule 1 [Astyanax mexicanus]|uniref:CMRF35-like molecule 1 n=1 Tax=Astyanax mexicanus TaxID=7994 RepID=A0A8T2KYS7_ASTMX|nr:CMRF35-like molecule 1 [Astyanax mexicanus]